MQASLRNLKHGLEILSCIPNELESAVMEQTTNAKVKKYFIGPTSQIFQIFHSAFLVQSEELQTLALACLLEWTKGVLELQILKSPNVIECILSKSQVNV